MLRTTPPKPLAVVFWSSDSCTVLTCELRSCEAGALVVSVHGSESGCVAMFANRIYTVSHSLSFLLLLLQLSICMLVHLIRKPMLVAGLELCLYHHRLFGLVVRVSGYRFRGPGSIPGVPGSTKPCEYN
jgi:hypothetical protein